MSRNENHRYLLGLMTRFSRTTKAWPYAFAFFLVAFSMWQAFEPERAPNIDPLVPFVVVVCLFGYLWFKRRAANAQYLRLLQEPTSEPRVRHVREQLAKQSFPDGDAFPAQSTALAHMLYGEGKEAMAALAPIDWSRRAPYLQAVGLMAESLVVLICFEDVERGLHLTRRAQALGDISNLAPGSSAARAAFATNVALAEVLANEDTVRTHEVLRAGLGAKVSPMPRMFAHVGLVVIAQRNSDARLVTEHRQALAALAPHFDAMLFNDAEPVA